MARIRLPESTDSLRTSFKFQLPTVLQPRFTWKYCLASTALAYILYCLIFNKPFFSSRLPRYTGPYNVTAFSTLIMAIMYWAWISLRSTPGLTAFAVIFGFWSGGYVSQQAPMAAAEATDMRFAGTLVGQVMFFMSFAQLFGGPIFGALLGKGDSQSQLDNAPKAIAMGASMMTATTILLSIGRFYRSRELRAKV